jgi:hypothetical protein
MDRSSQEYIAAIGLKKETPMESRNTTGTAKPCKRWILSASSARSGATKRCPLVAYQEGDHVAQVLGSQAQYLGGQLRCDPAFRYVWYPYVQD